ncbi:Sensor protein ZraS [Pseudooceanicola marinus]|uniref:histidine kinase n=1 Tax=Pseudooceanicola marinus TaxID=396013 RepID=A0A1X6Z9S6_9RHOB|nr:ATP-binding protein [Pseudooceanicola marinus]PJE28178.1 PAS domain-containing sensor histidine kinase [Pseudooceanicola marinus]SLN45361.1 Sensor protein ZraS [Pseudooceanicola marinus]
MKLDLPQNAFTDDAWASVLEAVDRSYAELVAHQEQLERQNEELQDLRRFIGSVLDSVTEVMVVLDRDGTIEEVSASLAETTGAPADSYHGRPVAGLMTPAGAEMLSGALRGLRLSHAPAQFEAEIVTAEGPAPFEIGLSARVNERGRVMGAVLVGRPLGELRQAYSELEQSHRRLQEAQAQLVRNEKLASLGRLLAGVAHELNNPISFVYANAHALEKYLGRFEAYFDRVQAGAEREELVRLRAELKLDRNLKNLRDAIHGARDGAERVRDIVADLRRLSADGRDAGAPFDLVDTARVAAHWVERGSKSGITARITGLNTLEVTGTAGHVQQIVMNLVQNAMDALRGAEAPEVVIDISRHDGCARLTVTDNGPGIAPEHHAAIFDPFFTTKPVGQGTGLGLSISHKIAEEHGGRLALLPSEHGAAFCLTLPITPGETCE